MYMPKILNLVVAYFKRYHTLTSIAHGRRFHKVLHKNCNISQLQISWDITPESKYPMVADFMRYYTRITIKYGCRFHNILQPNLYISWLHISWNIHCTRTQIVHGCIFHEILHENCNISWLQIWERYFYQNHNILHI